MEVPEQDYHNFSTPSSHRLPTVTGTQALRNARRNAQPIPTSLALLDAILGKSLTVNLSSAGGLQRGLVTEVFGPPGVGKTTFALQVAVNALHASASSSSVTWIDTSSQLIQSRLRQVTDAYRLPSGHDPPSSPPLPQCSKDTLLADKFNYLQVYSLPRLLALFVHSTASFPPPNTTVIVIDDLSNLILSSLPRSTNSGTINKTPQRTTSSIQDAALAKRALTRRFQVLSSFAASLQKFAAANNVAILVTSKATVNLKSGQRAVLRPALTSQQWDNYLSVRIALYRDFWPDETTSLATQKSDATNEDPNRPPTAFERRSLRFAKVVRLGGKSVSSGDVGFVIEEGGLREVAVHLDDEAGTNVLPLATQPLRPLEDVLDPGANDNEEFNNDIEAGDDVLDTEADVDADIHVDAANNIQPEAPGASKRKAIEIAESDEDEDDNNNLSKGVISDDDEGNDDNDKDKPLRSDGSGGGGSGTNDPKGNDGFQPSSQVLLLQQQQQHQKGTSQSKLEPSAKTAKKFRADNSTAASAVSASSSPLSSPPSSPGVRAKTRSKRRRRRKQRTGNDDGRREGQDEQEEMLLEAYEQGVTSFSQAAVDSSQPLTPSDDGRDSS